MERATISKVIWIATCVCLTALTGCGETDKAKKEEVVIPKGDAGRRMYFEYRCELNHGGMCQELGVMYKRGWGGKKDIEAANKYFRRACELGAPIACEELGEKLSVDQEIGIHEKNCGNGNAYSCNNLGHLLWNGPEDERDLPRAREVLTKGCDGGIPASCKAMIAMWANGIGGDKNEEKAKVYKQKMREAVESENDLKTKYHLVIPESERVVGKAPESWNKNRILNDPEKNSEPNNPSKDKKGSEKDEPSLH